MSVLDTLQKPPVLIGMGAVVLILILASRGGSGSDPDKVSLSSIATQGHVRLAELIGEQNIAVSQFEASKALAAYELAKVRSGNDLATTVQAMRMVENLYTVNRQAQVTERQVSAGVMNNIITSSTNIVQDRIAADLRRFLGPLDAQTAVSLAQIQSASAERIAATNAAAQTTLAQIYATAAMDRNERSLGQEIGIGAAGIGNLVKSIAPIFGAFF